MSEKPGLSVAIRKHLSQKELYIPFCIAMDRLGAELFLNREILKDLDNVQQQFHADIKRSRKYCKGEKDALQFTSIDDAWTFLAIKKGEYDEQRNHGVKRLQKRTVEFAAAFNGILENMRPILEVTSNLASPSGSLAVGTVCFFFTVAKTRVAMETQIWETLLEIRDRLPGLKMYEHIYSGSTDLEQALQSKIVQAYAHFMKFIISAIKFYDGDSMRRWVKALGQPTNLADHVSNVKRAVVEVRLCCEEILNRNITSIMSVTMEQKDTIDELKKKITDLNGMIEGLQEKSANSKLFNIRESLGLGTYKTEDEIQKLQKYARYLPKDLSQNQDALARKQNDYFTNFRNKDPTFQSWRFSSHSRMLILSGYNENYQSHQCWLSPVALHMIEELLKQDKEPYAFYILGHSDDDSLYRVLSCLIAQLLASNPHALNKESQYSNLRDAVSEYRKARLEQSKADEQIRWLESALVSVLDMFNPVTAVWIILDRVDKCTPMLKYRESKRLLKTLVRAIKTSTVNVRVLAAVNGWNLKEEKYVDELEQTKTGTVEIKTIHERESQMDNF
ncbi:hypothetical protein BDV11DRAFT_167108 [Aspergillus similis]